MSQLTLRMSGVIWLILVFTTLYAAGNQAIWSKMATSSSYDNTKLVIHWHSPIQTLEARKENSILTTKIICMQACNANAKCVSINFYSTTTHHKCDLLVANICSQNTRVALQVWPGGYVWDKLPPDTTKSCIDQRVQEESGNICDIGRPGCRSTSNATNKLSLCVNCVSTCADCAKVNHVTANDSHICTLWPQGSDKSPIFGFCEGNATYLMQKYVNLVTGNVFPDYHMSIWDMHRLSVLDVYQTMTFTFISDLNGYKASYEDFHLNSGGALLKIRYKAGNGDGLLLGATTLLTSQWNAGNTTCGSSWYLKSTQPLATASCPGGGVTIFGTVNTSVSPVVTGIRWPIASSNETLYIADCKLEI